MKPPRRHQSANRAMPALPPVEAAARRGDIETLLQHGKSREAVEAAKQLLKQAPGPDTEEVAVRAYRARVQALQASGLFKEAQALGALASERFPAYRDQFTPLLRQSEAATGNFDTLLAELVTAEAPRRQELEGLLARQLTDPAKLAESTALPADHPLKRMARTVADLFTAVTSGPLPAGALTALRDIPRGSPLAPWRLLIRALEAYYRCDDATVLANLAGIPTDTAPGRLVPVLRRLVGGGDETQPLTPASTVLLEKVMGKRAAAQAPLQHLAQALQRRDERQGLTAVRALLPLVQGAPAAVRRLFIATVLHHWHRQGLRPEGLLRLLPHDKQDVDVLRLVALTVEPAGWDEALGWWHGYVTTATAVGALSATGPEIARVFLHMAELFPQDPEEVYEALDVASAPQLHALIRAGELPSYFDRGALLEQARAADPAPRVLRALVEHYDRWGDAKRAEATAEVWRRTHPQALEPVLYLIRAAERRGAVRKALALLAEAEAMDRVHPEVRQSRFRLLLAGAERRLKEGKTALARQDLAQLALEPRASEGDHKAYVSALGWVAAQQSGDPAAVEHAEQTLAATADNPALRAVLLETVAKTFKLAVDLPAVAPSPQQAIDALARACDLFRALDRPLQVGAPLVTQVEKRLAKASLAQLHALCLGGLWMERPALTYHAAGQGMAQDGPLLARFLLARGQALCACWGPTEQERAHQCLRVARELASRARDMETVREASAALATLPDWGMLEALMAGPDAASDATTLTPAAITRIIAQERRVRKAPRFAPAQKTRVRRRTRPKRQVPRGLFEELLSFLAFEGRL